MLNRSRASYLLALVYVASVVLHFAALRFQSGFPLLTTDEAQYVAIGENLRLGHGFVARGEFHSGMPPLYPLFVAFAHSLGPDPRSAALLMSCVAISLALFPVYRLARLIGLDRLLAALAATAAVLLPNTVLAGLYMAETLSYPLFFATLFAMARWLERPVVSRALIAGVLLSLMLLTKVAALSFTAAVLLAVMLLFIIPRHWLTTLRRPGATAIIVFGVAVLTQVVWQLFKARYSAAGLGMYGRAAAGGLPYLSGSLFAAHVADVLLGGGLLGAAPALFWVRQSFLIRPQLVTMLAVTSVLQVTAHALVDTGLTSLVQERLSMYWPPIVATLGIAGVGALTSAGPRGTLIGVPLLLLLVLASYPFPYPPVIDMPWAATLGTTGVVEVFSFQKARALGTAAAIVATTGTVLLALRGRRAQVGMALFVVIFNGTVLVTTAKKMSFLSRIGHNAVAPIEEWLRANDVRPHDRLVVTGERAFFQEPRPETDADRAFIEWQRRYLPVATELQLEVLLRLDLRLASSAEQVEALMRPGDRLLTASQMTGLRLVSYRYPLYLYQREQPGGSILPVYVPPPKPAS